MDVPWNDKDMRWALSYAINRDQIVSIAYEGTSRPAQFIFPAYPPLNRYVTMLEEKGLFTKYPIGQYNPAKAAQLIEAKGYKKGSSGYYENDGKQLSLPILVDEAYIELKRVAQVVVQQLQNDPKLDRLFVQAAAVWMADLPAIPLTQAKKLVPFDTYYWTGWPTINNFYAVPETWWHSTHAIIHNLRPTGR